jgi:hypothetical protein
MGCTDVLAVGVEAVLVVATSSSGSSIAAASEDAR